jgi:hypothetical protein
MSSSIDTRYTVEVPPEAVFAYITKEGFVDEEVYRFMKETLPIFEASPSVWSKKT